jgi:bacterial/archaeal transporter family protein
MPTYITWAVLGMASYSFGSFFVKLAERSGAPSSSIVLAVATTIVALASIAVVVLRGELKALFFDLGSGSLFWAIMAGLALAIAVSSLFHALSLGPTNVVVPIYGMFIIGGALLGVIFLGEPITWNKMVGLGAAIVAIVLISL